MSLDNNSPENYDENIRRTVPRYDDIIGDALDVAVNSGVEVKRWIDVGTGTGNMAFSAMKRFPSVHFTLLDISPEMLSLARKKVGTDSTFMCRSSDRMDLPDCSADVITCIQANHYYDDAGHARALSECYRVLRPGGLLIVTENIAPRTEEGYRIQRARMKEFLLGQGWTEELAEKYLNRYGEEFFPHTVEEHFKLLREAGFEDIELFFCSYAQAGFFAYRR